MLRRCRLEQFLGKESCLLIIFILLEMFNLPIYYLVPSTYQVILFTF